MTSVSAVTQAPTAWYVYAGDDLDAGRRLGKPLLDVPGAVEDTCEVLTYPALQSITGAASGPGKRHYWKGSLLWELSDDFLDAFVEQGRTTRPGAGIEIFSLGGAIADVADDSAGLTYWELTRPEGGVLPGTRRPVGQPDLISSATGPSGRDLIRTCANKCLIAVLSARPGHRSPFGKGDITSMNDDTIAVTGGVDCHQRTHHAAALDAAGRLLGDAAFPATLDGYRALLAWLQTFGTIVAIGTESTGAYGAGLTRFLRAAGITVVEVNQPHPHTRSRRGKSDAIDAEPAARKVLSGEATVVPKDTTGAVEAIRQLQIARRSAVSPQRRAVSARPATHHCA